MSLVTRALAATLSTALSVALLGLGTLAVDAAASDGPRINGVDQSVSTTTRTAAGMTRRPTFAGRWTGQETGRAIVILRGRNDVGRTTTYAATSPAPLVVRPGASSYCVRQSTVMRRATPAPGSWSWVSVLTVRRAGKVVETSRVSGSYAPGSSGPRTRVSTRGFAFRAGDHTTWRLSGEVDGQVEYVRTRATIAATC